MSIPDRLAALAEACHGARGFLAVGRPERRLGIIPVRRLDCKVWVSKYDGRWRVMLTEDDEHVVGAEFSLTAGESAGTAFLAAWARIDGRWLRVEEHFSCSAIRQRIESAVERAHEQLLLKRPLGRRRRARVLTTFGEMIAKDRLRFPSGYEDLRLEEIESGVVFFEAPWSAPARAAFHRFKHVMHAYADRELDMVVFKIECLNAETAAFVFDGDEIPVGGYGETVWVRAGRIIASEIIYEGLEPLVDWHTSSLFDESTE